MALTACTHEPVHMVGTSLTCLPNTRLLIAFKGYMTYVHETVGEINRLQGMIPDLKTKQTDHVRIHTMYIHFSGTLAAYRYM